MTDEICDIIGSGRIEPGIDLETIEDWGMGEADDSLFQIESMSGEPDTVGLVDGQISVIPGRSYNLVVHRDGSGAGEEVPVQLSAVAKACKDHGVRFDADFKVVGEVESITRYVVINNEVSHLRPKLVWPDGLEEQL